jgi:lipooligosaccharide transport system ATP-binding protein
MLSVEDLTLSKSINASINVNASVNTNALVATNLQKRYGESQVLDGLSFSIPRGACFGLLGPNGAGKTTTLRCCLALTQLDSGEITLLGECVTNARVTHAESSRLVRHRIGVVPQTDNLDPDFTVAENLLVYGRYFGLRDGEINARIPELLAFAALEHKRDAKISELSGGMKRRLTLARSLINDPDLIFLDEPTTGLDPQARHLIWDRLKALTAKGKSILLTTHFMDEAERLCGELLVIDKGKKIAQGAPRDLIAAHIEPEVVEVFGDGFREWLQAFGQARSSRVEISGETAFCYTHDPAALVANLREQRVLRYLHRPASLEDLFLKLTGREMREDS